MDFRGFPQNNPSATNAAATGGLGGASTSQSGGLGGAAPYVPPVFEGADTPEPTNPAPIAPKFNENPQPYVEITPESVATQLEATPVAEPVVAQPEVAETPEPVVAQPEIAPTPEPEIAPETTAQETPVVETEVQTANDEVAKEEALEVETTAEAVTVDLSSVIEAINGLTEKMDGMNDLFAKKMMHTTHEEKIVDQMHAELQKYKEDMYSQLIRPVLIDIIGVRDSIKRNVKIKAALPEEEQKVDLKFFGDYAYDLEDILDKNNVIIYSSKEGDSFTPIRQKVLKKIPTPVEELHGKIAESISDGYEFGGRVVVPEKVDVYLYEAPTAVEGEN